MRRTSSLRSRSISDHQHLRRSVAGAGRGIRPADRRRSCCPRSGCPAAVGAGSGSWPTRLQDSTGRPLATAWPRCTVIQASSWRCLLLGRVVGVPADGGGVEQQLGAGQRHQPRRFRIPLVPAHQHAEFAHRGVDRLEAEVAGREVELLVIRRIVGDVHLAVVPGDAAVAAPAPPRCCGTGPARAARTARRRCTTPSSRASGPRRSVVGPGIGFGQVETWPCPRPGRNRARMQFLQQHQLAPRRPRPRGCHGNGRARFSSALVRRPAGSRPTVKCLRHDASCERDGCGNCMVMQWSCRTAGSSGRREWRRSPGPGKQPAKRASATSSAGSP